MQFQFSLQYNFALHLYIYILWDQVMKQKIQHWSRGHQRSTKVNDLWWPDMTFFYLLCYKSVSDAEFEFSTY